MKRTSITLEDIAQRNNLALALHKAARGKRHRDQVIHFMQQAEQNLNRLAYDILNANMPYGRYREFSIHDPANYYLDGLDRLLNAQPAVRAHVRYMDDIVWWCDDKQNVKLVLDTVQAWLHEQRQLMIKPAWKIQRSAQGISYCGYRVLPGTMRLSIRRKRRYQQRRLYWERQYLAGNITATQLQNAYAAVHAITQGTNSLGWRRQNLRLHPPIDV